MVYIYISKPITLKLKSGQLDVIRFEIDQGNGYYGDLWWGAIYDATTYQHLAKYEEYDMDEHFDQSDPNQLHMDRVLMLFLDKEYLGGEGLDYWLDEEDDSGECREWKKMMDEANDYVIDPVDELKEEMKSIIQARL